MEPTDILSRFLASQRRLVPPTDYEQFKATIQRILRQIGKPMTWGEIKEAGRFAQKVPNNKWVKWMEEDIGLIREKTTDGKTVWRLS